MRKDAEANREKLVLAGRRFMQDVGGNVPVELICEAAGVTRGTFYRNFPDRATLYAAVLDHELKTLARQLDEPELAALSFLHLLAEMMMVFDRFMASLPDMSDFPKDGVSEAKILATITPSVEHAKATGLLRQDVSGDDVIIACRMVGSNWRLDRAPDRSVAMARRLTLIIAGLTSHDTPQRKAPAARRNRTLV